MYGDCQVALPSTMGGGGENGISSTVADCSSLFTSPIRNPNHHNLHNQHHHQHHNDHHQHHHNVNAFTFMASLPPAFQTFSPIIPVIILIPSLLSFSFILTLFLGFSFNFNIFFVDFN